MRHRRGWSEDEHHRVMTHPESCTPRERMLRAATCQPTDRPPVWLMRQAGRYLPEYHKVRGRGSFLEAVRNPERAAEITIQPIRRFGMDAAVIFSDILVPVAAMGYSVDFVAGRGPVIDPPIRDRAAIDRVHAFDPEADTGFLAESIQAVRSELGPDRAIIGFCGAPFTTASYMIEGQSSRNFEHTKGMLYGATDHFVELIDRVVDALVPYLGMQVEAGADLLQIFDSWGGALDATTYRRVLFEPMQRLVSAAKALEVPVILYANGCSHLLEVFAALEPSVIGIDWRVDPRDARRRVGESVALQGNLDPAALFAPPHTVAELTRATLEAFGPAPGHIFNLGSGVLPPTPIPSVEAVVRTVQEWTGR
jgi:uroporphyrinogen decarboxylase